MTTNDTPTTDAETLPRLTPTDADALTAELVADVDRWQSRNTADGRTVDVRLRVLPDDVDTLEHLNDDEYLGRFAWGRFDRYAIACDAYGHSLRPADMDGNAEILTHDHDHRESLWWQPPADVPRTSEHFAALRSQIRELVEYGFVGYVVDVRGTVDTPYGPRVVDIATASLWGIDTRDPSDYVEAVRDLVEECFDVSTHVWHAARFTGAVTCERCGLMPMESEDYDTPCEPTTD